MLKLVIAGAGGRMGQTLTRLVQLMGSVVSVWLGLLRRLKNVA